VHVRLDMRRLERPEGQRFERVLSFLARRSVIVLAKAASAGTRPHITRLALDSGGVTPMLAVWRRRVRSVA